MTKIAYISDNNEINVVDVDITQLENKDMLKSFNAPKYIKFGDKYGFLKISESTTPTLDKFEFIISRLGKELGMNIANTFVTLDEFNNITGVISESVLKENEILIEFGSNRLPQLFDIKNTEILELNSKLKSIPVNITLENKEDIFFVLNIFPNIVESFAKPNEVDEIVNDYYKMLMFDLITGNQDRNRNNFAIIKDKEGNHRFSPLFDNSTINIKDKEQNFRNVFGFQIRDLDIFNYLLEYRRDIIDPILDRIEDEDYINNLISSIGEKILDEGQQQWINTRISSNIKGINLIKNQSLGK